MPDTLPKFPQFDAFECAGESRTVKHGEYQITATLHEDYDCKPTDFDCYSEEDIARWRADQWSYVGVVLSVQFRGFMLDKHAAGLWGCDCNFNRTSNSHLSEVADELLSEALDSAGKRLDALLTAARALA